MLRLKIGKNFLLLNYQSNERTNINRAIPYMMGCFDSWVGAGRFRKN